MFAACPPLGSSWGAGRVPPRSLQRVCAESFTLSTLNPRAGLKALHSKISHSIPVIGKGNFCFLSKPTCSQPEPLIIIITCTTTTVSGALSLQPHAALGVTPPLGDFIFIRTQYLTSICAAQSHGFDGPSKSGAYDKRRAARATPQTTRPPTEDHGPRALHPVWLRGEAVGVWQAAWCLWGSPFSTSCESPAFTGCAVGDITVTWKQ